VLTTKSSPYLTISLLRCLFGEERDGHFMVRLSGLFSLLMGLLIFSLWVLAPQTLKTDFPTAAQISPFTALGLMIIGFNIRLLRWETVRVNSARIAKLFRVSILAIGAYGLTYYVGAVPAISWRIGGLDGRVLPMPSLVASFCFVCFGCIFYLINRSRVPWLAHSLSLAAAAVSLSAGIATLYAAPADLPQFHLLTSESPILPILFCISLALLSASAYRGWTAVIVSDTDGGQMARRLLPASILVPVVIGWIRLMAEQAGWVNSGLALTLHVLLSVFSMAMIVWWNAGMLVRTAMRGRQATINNHDLETAYRQTLEKCREVIFALDAHGDLTFLNPAAKAVFGVPDIPAVTTLHVRDVLGDSAWSALGPVLIARGNQPIRDVLLETVSADPQLFDLSTSVLFRGSQPFELLVVATPSVLTVSAMIDQLLAGVAPIRQR
jgi:PAS domain-containing protein